MKNRSDTILILILGGDGEARPVVVGSAVVLAATLGVLLLLIGMIASRRTAPSDALSCAGTCRCCCCWHMAAADDEQLRVDG